MLSFVTSCRRIGLCPTSSFNLVYCHSCSIEDIAHVTNLFFQFCHLFDIRLIEKYNLNPSNLNNWI